MLVPTNYPQVPIATSNVATDSARIDNQQRPPIIPPKEATKGHEERSFNPQNERSAEQANAKLLDKVQQKQQQQGSEQHQQQEQKSKSQGDRLLAQLRKNLPSKPALQRKDIRLQTSPQTKPVPQHEHKTPVLVDDKTMAFYQEFGQRIGQFYQSQTEPNMPASISDWG